MLIYVHFAQIPCRGAKMKKAIPSVRKWLLKAKIIFLFRMGQNYYF